ncbi:MAG: hypothetical protein ACFFCM_00555 [Promethearchaeota archaeon]
MNLTKNKKVIKIKEIKRLVKIRKKKPGKLFSGTIQGVVTSNGLFAMATRKDHRWALLLFSIKMDESIEDIPEEITVYSNSVTNIRIGDRVTVIGKIVRYELEQFPEGNLRLEAEHIYNETLKCGF